MPAVAPITAPYSPSAIVLQLNCAADTMDRTKKPCNNSALLKVAAVEIGRLQREIARLKGESPVR